MKNNGFNEKVNMMLDIDEYALIIGNGRSIRGQINTAISYLKEFFGDKLEVTNIFISNWKAGNDYISDTSLWVFTKNTMIKCLNYKDVMGNGILNFEVYPLKILYANIEYKSMRSAIIKIHMPCITVQFEAIDGNLKHLMNIYSNYFMQV